MDRVGLDALAAFEAVASERSFTRAAARLGVSTSALSHSLRGLEERLGLRLLARTTRSVAPTEAGERLLLTLQPALKAIQTELDALDALRAVAFGPVRVTTTRHGYHAVLKRVLPVLAVEHPRVHLEIAIDDAFTDIVSAGFDAGLRFGGLVAKDMIAVRAGPGVEAAVVASPRYFERHTRPLQPRDLSAHRCIGYRLPTSGALYAWRFEKGKRRVAVRGEGGPVFNDGDVIRDAALEGLGVAYLFWDQVAADVAQGRLVRVLADWCPPFEGYHLYHSSRRHPSTALQALIGVLRRPARQAE